MTEQDAAAADREPPVVLVQLDDYKGTSVVPSVPNVVPVTAKAGRARIQNKYHRFQLPLRVAHCSTFHKAQGLTCRDGVVIRPSQKPPFAMGLEYVGISRATSMEKVILLSPFQHDKHFNNFPDLCAKVASEYERLRRELGSTQDDILYLLGDSGTPEERAAKRRRADAGDAARAMDAEDIMYE